MSRFFQYDSPVFSCLSRLADLMMLSVLWLGCCIPVITIGASTTAMYAVQVRMIKKQEPEILRTFFSAFQENFQKATRLFLSMLPVMGLLLLNVYGIVRMEGVPGILRTILVFANLLLAMMLQLIFPLTAMFDNTIAKTLKNAVLLSLSHYFPCLLALLISLVPLLGLFQPGILPIFPFWLLLGIPLAERWRMRILMRIFQKYIPQDTKQ